MAFGNWLKETFGGQSQQDYTGGSSPTDPTSAVPGTEDPQSMAGIAYDSRTAQSEGRQFGSQDFDVTDEGQVKNIQQILINEGYDIGGADGMFGPKSEAAYRDFINKTRTAHGGEAYRHNVQEAQPGYFAGTPFEFGGTPAVPYESPPLTMHGAPHDPKTGDR